MYGGACGGGKSDAILMAALQYVNEAGYAAIIFRETFTDLSEPGALIARSHEWLDESDAHWDGINHAWTFPSGAKLVFGYLEHAGDEKRYKGAEFHGIFFDQVEEILESQYRFMSSRARRLADTHIPIRIWSTANPDGYAWVKQRFIVEGEKEGRFFIPAKLSDNPALDREDYIKSLANLDPVHREQLLNGNWDVKHTCMFKRGWFEVVKDYPKDVPVKRFWDKAATKAEKGKDPDWTVGVKACVKNGVYYIIDVVRFRDTPQINEATIKQTAILDKHEVTQYMEQEPGGSGVNDVDHYTREVLVGYTFYGIRSTGNKELYAAPVSSAAQAGNVKIIEADWNTDFLDEFESFPMGGHDDIVDATSKCIAQLATSQPLGGGSISKVNW